MKRWNIETIDVLKIDIEASEREVFNVNPEAWLGKIRVLLIEIHDRKRSGCSKVVFSSIDEGNFSHRMGR